MRASDSPFAMANKLFPDSYYGETEPVDHKLPVYSNGKSFSFKDLIDIINPLQHLPVISTIYREVTGDEPGAVGRLVGAALYGGPLGLVGEEINCAIADKTGKDVGEHAIAAAESALSGQAGQGGTATATASAAQPVALAAAEPPPPVATPQAAVTSVPAATAAMAFGGTGLTPVAAEAPAAAKAAPPPVPAPPGPAGTASTGMPLIRPQHFMPVPQRRAVEVKPAPLPVSLPLSGTGQRSSLPVSGVQPASYPGPSAAVVQKILAAESHAGETIPSAPPGTPGSAPLPTPTGPGSEGRTWFSAAMMDGLSKYEKIRKLQDANPTP
ncbi:MAG: hypothetical protein M0006_02550 [Magnetospirillum sp.]|nr:hypothetical protein [Magnetospirillum sp.]